MTIIHAVSGMNIWQLILRLWPADDAPPARARTVTPTRPRSRKRSQLTPALEADVLAWCTLWQVPELPGTLDIRFSGQLRTSLGRCHPVTGRIRLHDALKSGHDELLREVLCHEAAHAAVFAIHRRRLRPHGREWRALMKAAGFVPRATYREPWVRQLLGLR